MGAGLAKAGGVPSIVPGPKGTGNTLRFRGLKAHTPSPAIFNTLLWILRHICPPDRDN